MLVVQAISKLNTLIVYGDTTIIESMEVDHFDTDYIITSNDGLSFAFGIVSFDADTNVDPDYGELVARYESWGLESSTYENPVIPLKKCTKE